MSQKTLISNCGNNPHLDREGRSKPLHPFSAFMRLGLILGLLLSVSLVATAQSLTTLHSFSGYNSSNPSASDGADPLANLILGTDGNFYGTTSWGGAYAGPNGTGLGTVFKMMPGVSETVLHSFSGYNANNPSASDGSGPAASLVLGTDGNFYGTTPGGGAYNKGTVFKITPAGVETVLYSFSGYNSSNPPASDGAGPAASLILGTDGDFYGTTEYGGAYGSSVGGYGTVFKITPGGSETVLHSFSGYNSSNPSASDGANPTASLILGADGNFYGTTVLGGAHGPNIGLGTIFKITPNGTESVFYSFDSYPGDGAGPAASLILGSDGNFYGTTEYGGNGDGTVFKITPAGSETVLYSFLGGSDGYYPLASLLQGSDGNFYGTTEYGGTYSSGTIFKVTPSGSETVLYSFGSQTGDGGNISAGLILGSDGGLYGTSVQGGSAGNHGTVYRFSESSSAPILKSLSPSSKDAGGPAFTLIVKGSLFQASSSVNWNSSPLTTTYVSTTELKAAVPASLIAQPGTAAVTVATGASVSNSKTFTILVTSLKLASASLTKNSDSSYTAKLTIKNIGYNTAPNLNLKSATLGAAATTASLPLSLGNLAAGASANASLHFPASAGSSGQVVYLKVSGTFTGGRFSGSLKVTLP